MLRAATFGAVGDKIESEIEAAVAGGLDQIDKIAEARLEVYLARSEKSAESSRVNFHNIALLCLKRYASKKTMARGTIINYTLSSMNWTGAALGTP